jgi:hypothetical protein
MLMADEEQKIILLQIVFEKAAEGVLTYCQWIWK